MSSRCPVCKFTLGECCCTPAARWVDAPLDPNPHSVTRQLEQAIGAYTGAPYVVTTTSCTQAILMALAWWRTQQPVAILPSGKVHRGLRPLVSMPKLSYVGVPAAVLNAGAFVAFHDEDWQGEYNFGATTVWDSARRFTSGMFRPGAMQCVSFHATKILADTQGGAILLDDPEADRWLRRARFDGRTEGVDPKDDQVQFPSWHAYLSCDVAARLLWKLQGLPRHNPDLPRSDYPDLSTLEAFK
jgi:dTDP-4-amino-4,6-dideoxygalactose transaminase